MLQVVRRKCCNNTRGSKDRREHTLLFPGTASEMVADALTLME
jgi:hypothetical protein